MYILEMFSQMVDDISKAATERVLFSTQIPGIPPQRSYQTECSRLQWNMQANYHGLETITWWCTIKHYFKKYSGIHCIFKNFMPLPVSFIISPPPTLTPNPTLPTPNPHSPSPTPPLESKEIYLFRRKPDLNIKILDILILKGWPIYHANPYSWQLHLFANVFIESKVNNHVWINWFF